MMRKNSGRSPAVALMKLAAIAIAWGMVTPATAQRVVTRGGAVEGTTADGVAAWLGIPFAAPPVGDRRWQPPQPAAPWTGVYQATRFAPSCMQPLRDHEIAYYVGDDPIAEDCLYLNVWAPAGTRADAKLPVIVYVHGGSFVAGSGRKPLYTGEKLSGGGAVVVSINYRLGALGFLAHPALTAESPNHASGNYGFMDQIAALRWVRDNIAGFGGDPARVTIMGQSAGSMSISALQVSPAARGLFHRIVGMSGSSFPLVTMVRSATLPAAEAAGVRFQQELGAADMAALRRMPADRIIAARTATRPDIDGVVLTKPALDAYRTGGAADVPLLLGTVRDEALDPGVGKDLAGYRARVGQLFGAAAPQVLALYPASDDATARTSGLQLYHDAGFGSMMRNWARLQLGHGRSPVYAYSFERRHPYTPGVRFSDINGVTTGVNHTDEVGYFLGTLDSFNITRRTRDWTDQDRALSAQIRAAIIAFAATGNPNTPALRATWPRYTMRGEEVLRLDLPLQVVPWRNAQKLDRLAAIPVP